MKDDEFTEPIEWDEEGKPTLFRWDSDKWFNNLSPPVQRNLNRHRKIWEISGWMVRNIPWYTWPPLHYVYSFWYSMLEDGILDTCKPRWGAVTFGWLNDGIKPTVWHTWRQLTHKHSIDPYTGIYPMGAPKSLKQAKEWEDKWEQERKLRDISN